MLARKTNTTAERLAAERLEIDRITGCIAEVDTSLNAALLAADATAVEKLDAEIATLRKEADRRRRTIGLLEKEKENAERAAVAKRQEAHKGRLYQKMAELRQVVAEFQKTQGEAVKLHRRWHKLAIELAIAWPWGPGQQSAAGFHPDEVTRDTQAELCRVGSGELINAGSIRTPSFPGGRNPRLDWIHSPEKIPPLIDTIDERLNYARNVLHGKSTERKLA